ncbi:hypothetical protein KI387_003681, partial [Taxus chinensis]
VGRVHAHQVFQSYCDTVDNFCDRLKVVFGTPVLDTHSWTNGPRYLLSGGPQP